MNREERELQEEEIILEQKNYFISFEEKTDSALTYFHTMLSKETQGIIITRFAQTADSVQARIYSYADLLKEKDVMQLSSCISSLREKGKKTILFLDRIDYLFNQFTYEKTLRALYQLNDEQKQITIILRVSESSLSLLEKGKLQAEFRPLPKPEVFHEITLQHDLFELLLFIDNNDTKISFKTVCKYFDITKVTARKRIYELHARDLIMIKTDGRSKIITLTRKGQQLCRDLT